MLDLTKKRVLRTKAGYEFEVWSDGYRLRSRQISELPQRNDYDSKVDGKYPIIPMPENGWPEECVYEWKHSDATCAQEIAEQLLALAFEHLSEGK